MQLAADPFAATVTGWLFVGAAAMLWGGSVLSPAHVGPFFEPNDFERVYRALYRWIWLFRIHLFGYIVTAMALVAFGAVVDAPSRVLVWPAVAVAAAGLLVSALASAFYYHFGAWGSIDMKEKSESELSAFIEKLKVGTEYVTCLTRFGRVFFGLGMFVLAIALYYWQMTPLWLTVAAWVLGLAAMAVTMLLPDHLHYYTPLFHLNAAWLVGLGILMMRSGA